jgi:SHS2 domain-containing protein
MIAWPGDQREGCHGIPGRMTMAEGQVAVPAEPVPSTSRVPLRVQGRSLAEIMNAAALTLADRLLPTPPPAGDLEVRDIVLGAPGLSALLVEWLNALIHLAQRDHWVPVRIDFREISDTHLWARASGVVSDQAAAPISAVVRERVSLSGHPGDWEVEVLLDR